MFLAAKALHTEERMDSRKGAKYAKIKSLSEVRGYRYAND
jgi:hypothetical protein